MNAVVHPEQGATFDLSARTKLRITGSDRLRYLNGQISNDLRKASEAVAIHACVLNAKGKINADVFICADGDSFLIDSEAGLGEQLTARLERYIIADDVQVEDVSAHFALFHCIGMDARDLAAAERCVRADRYGCAGMDLWVKRVDRDAVAQTLATQLPFCDAECEERFRIERGIPRWGRELSEEIIPNEANLEPSAIDYAKGCYIGQEVISRIKMSGQTNKRLCGLITTDERPLHPGMRLWATEPEAKEVGWITSATKSRIGAQIALAFIKRGFQFPGTQLEARSTVQAEASPLFAQVVDLPFI